MGGKSQTTSTRHAIHLPSQRGEPYRMLDPSHRKQTLDMS